MFKHFVGEDQIERGRGKGKRFRATCEEQGDPGAGTFSNTFDLDIQAGHDVRKGTQSAHVHSQPAAIHEDAGGGELRRGTPNHLQPALLTRAPNMRRLAALGSFS